MLPFGHPILEVILMNFNIRTDLALENHEIYQTANKKRKEIPGIEAFFDDSDQDIHISTVKVLSDIGSKALSKPIGKYVTIESQYMNDEVERIDKKIVNVLAQNILTLTNLNEKDSVLVVGLRKF